MPKPDERLQKVLDLITSLREDDEARQKLMPVWNGKVAQMQKAGVALGRQIVVQVQNKSAKNAADLLKKLKNYPDIKRSYDTLVSDIERANAFIGNITKQKYKLWKKNIDAFEKQEKEDNKEISKSRDTSPVLMQTNATIIAKYNEVKRDKDLQAHFSSVENEKIPKFDEDELKKALGSIATVTRYFIESQWDDDI